MGEARLDEIGYWSEIKLDIIRKYATAYSTIMFKQQMIRSHIYIDGFAGAGVHVSKTTGEFVPGSPLNALLVQPPFREFHFIDLDGKRAELLRQMSGGRGDVHVYEGDCNDVLLNKVFPRVRYNEYKRALCLLDPYGLSLNWEVLKAAGQEKSIEIFLNFSVMDANMNVLRRDRENVDVVQRQRLTAFWGDESYQEAMYSKVPTLFGESDQKANNEVLAEAFRNRLKKVAGFEFVPKPIPMRNTRGVIVYYLYFASPNPTGARIVGEIFDAYRDKGTV